MHLIRGFVHQMMAYNHQRSAASMEDGFQDILQQILPFISAFTLFPSGLKELSTFS